MRLAFFSVMLLLAMFGCKPEQPQPASAWQGSGVVVYTDYEPFASKQMRVFYYVPSQVAATTPIVFVMHGAERNALEYRNAIINKAEQKGFIAVVPEFSEINFPDVNGYQIGNIYLNGDAPSAETLRPETEWALSVIEPLFSYVKVQTQNSNSSYHMIGHSGGAQFAHRFLLCKRQLRLQKLVISAAGWYTATDAAVNFPYGQKNSILEGVDLAPVFAQKVFVQVGTADNSTNTTSIRRDAQAEAQGASRLARAQYFFQKANNRAAALAVPFQWELHLIAGLGHDFNQSLPHSADLLFP
jgi:hypothetical protein